MLRLFCRVLFVLFAFEVLCPYQVAIAENAPASSENFAFARGVAGEAIKSPDLSVVTDGEFVVEGGSFDSPGTIVSEKNVNANLIIDFDSPERFQAFILQADWNDTYFIEGSNDQASWSKLWIADKVGVFPGLRTRKIKLSEQTEPFRYLRIRAGNGDEVLAISEFQAYNSVPNNFENLGPQITLIDSYAWLPGLSVERVDNLKQILLVLSFGLLIVMYLTPAGRSCRSSKRLLAGACGLAFLFWSNCLQFHYDAYVHRHEFFHYFLGAKYHRQLSYSRLYECATVADFEYGAVDIAHPRQIRNLLTNEMESSLRLLQDPELCTQHFSESEWTSFKADVAWFRVHMPKDDYTEIYSDHGFNGTPVWLILGSLFAKLDSASNSFFFFLGSFDLVLMLIGVILLYRTFGLLNAAPAILFWGCNFIARFAWTGNGLLRADWLFFMTVAICMLKRKRLFAAGVCSSCATLLRLFPVFLPIGVVLTYAVRILFRRSQLSSADVGEAKEFISGLIVGAVALLLLAMMMSDGLGAWQDFYFNTVKHYKTASTNMMGLESVVQLSRASFSTALKDPLMGDPYAAWQELLNQQAFSSKVIFLILVSVIGVVLLRVTKRLEIWEAAVVFLTLAACIRLSNYDYYFLMFFGLLGNRSHKIPLALILLGVFSWRIAAMYGEEDFGYFMQSLCVGGFLAYSLITLNCSARGQLLSSKESGQSSPS